MLCIYPDKSKLTRVECEILNDQMMDIEHEIFIEKMYERQEVRERIAAMFIDEFEKAIEVIGETFRSIANGIKQLFEEAFEILQRDKEESKRQNWHTPRNIPMQSQVITRKPQMVRARAQL
ncbi:hypothetical protein [Salipaludibacillus aurantiacus]|uniref:Uncharacterized protein n=1 Tax=Salipaludibacillus aurantiacus TaxID=1601833 RepID=A0A1H9U0U1_9BACI|nr:hypothetical protein [Salipaludibacillus aurantiacus]SES02912.1 hypothetical protein SAMN05518684_106214 [Salipaludibacillus aurantiacus]